MLLIDPERPERKKRVHDPALKIGMEAVRSPHIRHKDDPILPAEPVHMRQKDLLIAKTEQPAKAAIQPAAVQIAVSAHAPHGNILNCNALRKPFQAGRLMPSHSFINPYLCAHAGQSPPQANLLAVVIAPPPKAIDHGAEDPYLPRHMPPPPFFPAFGPAPYFQIMGTIFKSSTKYRLNKRRGSCKNR